MAVQVKASVSYAEKMGQPNFGSIGAQCGVDIEITQEDLAAGRLQEEIRMGFEACRQAVKAELGRQCVAEAPPPAPAPEPAAPVPAGSPFAAITSPKAMADALREWSQLKPIGEHKAKWEPLLAEAKALVNAKVTSGEWTNYEIAVDTIKGLESLMDTVQQGEMAF